MADPTTTVITSGTSTSATTTINFTAVSAGTLLVLSAACDDYKTGDPSGWTLSTGCSQQTYLGHYLWWKIASGSETSVAYTIGSATGSVYGLLAYTDIAGTGTLDISNGQLEQPITDATFTTPSVSTTSGRRLAVAAMGASHNADGAGASTWINSFTERVDLANTGVVTKDALGIADLVFDGGGSIQGGTTWATSPVESLTGIIAVFKVAASGVTATAIARTASVQTYPTTNASIVIGGASKQGIWT